MQQQPKESHWSALCGEQHGGHHFATIENFVAPPFGVLSVAWSSCLKGAGEVNEVQRKALKIIKMMKQLPYSKKLKTLQQLNLERRKLHGIFMRFIKS